MKYLESFDKHNSDLLLESLTQDQLVKKLKYWMKSINAMPSRKKTNYMLGIVTTLLSFMYSDQVLDVLKQVGSSELIESFFETKKSKKTGKLSRTSFQKIEDLSATDFAKNFIKEEEKPRLTAYDIGDGHISIGWGHAEPKSRSTYKIGDKITMAKAEKLFQKDFNSIESAVKRNIKGWDIELTQDMYDVLISLAYNAGPTGLMNMKFIPYLKKGEYEKAGKLIKKSGLRAGFGGLEKRRNRESKIFLSFLNEPSED